MPYRLLGSPYRRDIIVGGYGPRRGRGRPVYPGPVAEAEWERDRLRGYYQNVRAANLVNMEYLIPGGSAVKIYQVSSGDLGLIDETFNHIPPAHLRWLISRKPAGIILANEAGRGRSARFTGGLNAPYDNRATTFFNESEGIIITYGAIWNYRSLGISPTIMHEIGHVMTHRGKISYRHFPVRRREIMGATQVSRNRGALEALCNAYMYLLCYGSTTPSIQAFGNRRGDIQRDPVSRNALRRTPAFNRMIGMDWIERLRER